MTTEQKHDYPTPGSTTFRSQEWRVVRGFRLSALAVASFLVALVLFPTLDPGRLQAQELTDRQILVHLYDATDGPNWTDNSNWNTTADLADWHGVRTNDHGRVTGLNLQGNQLLGEIPPELGDLADLSYLELSNNRLSGEIPSELRGLTSLTRMYLHNNQLTGEIPGELGDVYSLNYLKLSNNQLSGEIPGELGQLTGLRSLHLYGNRLTGELPDLNALRYLTHLSLGGNDLDISWSTFESGGALDLASESWWNDPHRDRSLWSLYLQESGLTGQIPEWIGANHTGLRRLWLNDNALTGDVPANFGDMRDLESLRLHGNMLTGRWESQAWWRELTDLTLPIDRFVNQGGLLVVVDDSTLFLKLALPSSVDPMRTHLGWNRATHVPFDNQLQPRTRTALIVKIVKDWGANIVIELRNSQDGNADGLQNIPAVVCLHDPSTGESGKPALLTHDGVDWRVLADTELPSVFTRAVGNAAVCGTTVKESALPNTGDAAPTISWLLVLVIIGAATTLAGASMAKRSRNSG